MAEVEVFLSRARVGAAALYFTAVAVLGAVMATRALLGADTGGLAPLVAIAPTSLATLYALGVVAWLLHLMRGPGPALVIGDRGIRYPYLDDLLVPWANVRAVKAMPLGLGIEIAVDHPRPLLAALRPALRVLGAALLLGRSRYLLCLPTPLLRATSRRRLLEQIAARLPAAVAASVAAPTGVWTALRLVLALNLVWFALLLAVAATQAFYLADRGSFLLFLVIVSAPPLTALALLRRRPLLGILALTPNSACLLLILIGAFGGGLSLLGVVIFIPPFVNLWALLHGGVGLADVAGTRPLPAAPGSRAAAFFAALRGAALVLNLGALTIILYWVLSKGFQVPHPTRVVWLGSFAAMSAGALAALLSGARLAARAALALNLVAPLVMLWGAGQGWFHDLSGETAAFLAIFFVTAAVNTVEAIRRELDRGGGPGGRTAPPTAPRR